MAPEMPLRSSVTFRDDAKLDPSQVNDSRGSGGLVIGGGIGIVILIAALLLGVDPTAILQPTDTATDTTVQNGPSVRDCQSGADATRRADCRSVGFVDSVQAYWRTELPRHNVTYAPAKTVLFSGATQSACGTAVTEMGPFYCPEDEQVYLDISFFTDLRSKLGARAGPLAQGYVVAHEYGHRVQHL